MSKTITVSDELYDAIIDYSIRQTCPEKDDDESFNPMDWFGGNYDDCYEEGTIDGYIELSKRIVDSARAEEERK